MSRCIHMRFILQASITSMDYALINALALHIVCIFRSRHQPVYVCALFLAGISHFWCRVLALVFLRICCMFILPWNHILSMLSIDIASNTYDISFAMNESCIAYVICRSHVSMKYRSRINHVARICIVLTIM